MGDGLKDSGHKPIGHSLNALSVGLVMTSPFVIDYEKSKLGYYLASYTFLRFALFDYSYNLSRGLPLGYIGNTSLYDKVLQKFDPPDNFLFGRSISFGVGIAIPLNDLNTKKQSYKNTYHH
jgi:hypothetical protein